MDVQIFWESRDVLESKHVLKFGGPASKKCVSQAHQSTIRGDSSLFVLLYYSGPSFIICLGDEFTFAAYELIRYMFGA